MVMVIKKVLAYSIISIIRPGRLSYNFFSLRSYGTFNRDSLKKIKIVRLIETVRLSIKSEDSPHQRTVR